MPFHGSTATLRNREKVQPHLAGAHARISVHVLNILNHAMGEHRPNRDSATPNSLPRAIKLWYLMPALLHSPDGWIKKRQRFALVESGDIVLLLPWLMAFTRGRDSRPRDAALEASEEAKLERASSACRHAGGVKVAARNLLAEPRSEETRRRGTHWCPSSHPKTTPLYPRRRRRLQR